MTREFLIEGRGLAGYNLADKLAQQGNDVLVAGREFEQARSWFALGSRMPEEVMESVRSGEIRSHELTGCRFCIFNNNELIKDFTTDLSGLLPSHACFMVDDRQLKDFYRKKALDNTNVTMIDATVGESRAVNSHHKVRLSNGEIHTAQVLVDASGTKSNLQRTHEPVILDDDPLVMWYYGARVQGEFDPNIVIFPLKDVTTGRLSYITPWSDKVADVIACDYCRLSDYRGKKEAMAETYELFVGLCSDNNIATIGEKLETISGRVRIVPIKTPSDDCKIFAVGDAAGQADPNMSEGVPVALGQSSRLADQFDRNPKLTPRDYFRSWRYGPEAELPYDLSESFLLKRIDSPIAGRHASLYESLAKRDPETQLRILTERRLRKKDWPKLLSLAIQEPQTAIEALYHISRAKLIGIVPRYQEQLYGKQNSSSRASYEGSGVK